MSFIAWVRSIAEAYGRSRARDLRRRLDKAHGRIAALESDLRQAEVAMDECERARRKDRDEQEAAASAARRRIEDLEESEHELSVKVRNREETIDNLNTAIRGQAIVITMWEERVKAETARASATIVAAERGIGGATNGNSLLTRPTTG